MRTYVGKLPASLTAPESDAAVNDRTWREHMATTRARTVQAETSLTFRRLEIQAKSPGPSICYFGTNLPRL